MPTRNRPEHLLEALATLLDQTHEDWRALVVDDGAGEGVWAAHMVGDPRIAAFANPGRGQVAARNAALRAAEGDVVMLLDDDDLLLDPDHMRLVIDRLTVRPALVHRAGWLMFEENGREMRREVFAPPTDADSLRRDNTVLTCGLAWPRALHDLLGPFDPAMDGYFDWDWILRVLDAGIPLAGLSDPGVGYRVHVAKRSRRRSEARTAAFERFRTKHGLAVRQKNHLAVFRESRVAGNEGMDASVESLGELYST